MFITTEGATIFTTAFGQPTAPAIIAIGGWIGSWELWQQPFSLLSRNWYTIAYDHRGCGATEAMIPSISHEQLLDDLIAVLDAYGIERAIVAAESAGALTALAAAQAHPGRVAGLVLVAGRDPRHRARQDEPFYNALQSNYTSALDQFVEACVPEANSQHLKRWGRHILDRATPAAALALYGLEAPAALLEQLPTIAQPTLIVHGSADVIAPLAAAQWLAQTLPQAKLVVVEGAGHVPTMTRPGEVVRAIEQFFAPNGQQ
jgi:pimeloyl-ACP methyl ester carboxylesterase